MTGEAASQEARRRGVSAIRRVTAQGESVLLSGPWPTNGRLYGKDTYSFRLALASPSDHWLQRRRLPNGDRLEATASLRSFVGERREELAQIGTSLAVGLFGLIAASIFATRQALRPLRAATLAVEGIDERNLHARLALRGTRDDMDRHARALNHVLARLEHAFARISASARRHPARDSGRRWMRLLDLGVRVARTLPAGGPATWWRSARPSRRSPIMDNCPSSSRARAGEKLGFRSQPVDLDRAAGSPAPRSLRPRLRATSGGISPCTSIAPAAGALARTRIRSCSSTRVSNLIDNAIRHTPRRRPDSRSRPACGERTIRGDLGARLAARHSRQRPGPGLRSLRAARPCAIRKRSRARPLAGETIARLLGGDARVEDSALGGAALCVRIRTELPLGATSR